MMLPSALVRSMERKLGKGRSVETTGIGSYVTVVLKGLFPLPCDLLCDVNGVASLPLIPSHTSNDSTVVE